MQKFLNFIGIKTNAQKRQELLERAAWLESIGNFREAAKVYHTAKQLKG